MFWDTGIDSILVDIFRWKMVRTSWIIIFPTMMNLSTGPGDWAAGSAVGRWSARPVVSSLTLTGRARCTGSAQTWAKLSPPLSTSYVCPPGSWPSSEHGGCGETEGARRDDWRLRTLRNVWEDRRQSPGWRQTSRDFSLAFLRGSTENWRKYFHLFCQRKSWRESQRRFWERNTILSLPSVQNRGERWENVIKPWLSYSPRLNRNSLSILKLLGKDSYQKMKIIITTFMPDFPRQLKSFKRR